MSSSDIGILLLLLFALILIVVFGGKKVARSLAMQQLAMDAQNSAIQTQDLLLEEVKKTNLLLTEISSKLDSK